jgi:hypothetical protein
VILFDNLVALNCKYWCAFGHVTRLYRADDEKSVKRALQNKPACKLNYVRDFPVAGVSETPATGKPQGLAKEKETSL